MGNQQSEDKQSILPSSYEQVRQQNGGMILFDKKTQSNFLLQQFNHADKNHYQKQVQKYLKLKNSPCQSLLNVVEVYNQEYNKLCSRSYKIYVLYEYSSITLEQEINARKKEEKYFEEHQLWAILQSCSNAILQVKPTLSLHPSLVFIGAEGVLKIINDDMIREDHRSVLNQDVYYAPEKIENFSKKDKENSLKKEAIFSLGMTILHSAVLSSVYDCYDYENYEFRQQNLSEYIEILTSRYSEQFINVLNMVLDINPKKRSSLMEVKQIVTQVWNTEENSIVIEKQEIKANEKSHNSSSEQIPQEKQQISVPTRKQSTASIKKQNYDTFKPIEITIERNYSQNAFKPQQHQITHERQPSRILKEINPSNLYTNPKIFEKPKSKADLFTDPKLLLMIKQDLHDLGELRKSTLRCQSYLDNLPSNNNSLAYSHIDRINTSYRPSDIYSNQINRKYSESRFDSNPRYDSIQKFDTIRKFEDSHRFDTSYQNSYSNQKSFDNEHKMFQKKGQAIFVIEEYEDGNRFQGMVVNGVKEGPGKLFYIDGAFYEGDFKNNRMHGKGVLYYGVNRPAYDGEWFEDQFHGYGILINEQPFQNKVPFDFSNFHYIDNNWLRYEGYFCHDEKSGDGKLYLANGQTFEGQFSSDQVNGYGKFRTLNGDVVEGIWENNQLLECD